MREALDKLKFAPFFATSVNEQERCELGPSLLGAFSFALREKVGGKRAESDPSLTWAPPQFVTFISCATENESETKEIGDFSSGGCSIFVSLSSRIGHASSDFVNRKMASVSTVIIEQSVLLIMEHLSSGVRDAAGSARLAAAPVVGRGTGQPESSSRSPPAGVTTTKRNYSS